MNYLDIIILIVTGLLIVRGVRKGFIISLASLIALVLGIYVAIHFSNVIGKVIISHFHPGKESLPALSFAVTFFLIVIAVILIAKGIEKIVDLAGMGFFNHILGGILGMAKGLLILSVIFFIIHGFDPGERLIKPESKKQSMFYSPTEKVFPLTMKLFGQEVKAPQIPKMP
ncbi:MAG: CvpA family protein [Bacteroidota bacterium]|nr:CvpA family protein [Bacteroidota bacterium]